MTDPTTTTPIYTPQQKLAAHEKLGQLEARLQHDFAGSDVSPEKLRLIDDILTQRTILAAPEPAPPAGVPWQERRAHRENQRALRTELLEHTHEGTPEAAALIDDTLAEQRDYDAKTPRPVQGTVTMDTVRQARPASWTPSEGVRFDLYVQQIGATPEEALEFQGFMDLHRETARTMPPAAVTAEEQTAIDAVLQAWTQADDDGFLASNFLAVPQIKALMVKVGRRRLATR